MAAIDEAWQGWNALAAAEQDALLRDASTADAKSPMRRHFQNLKDWIAGAYYSSEPGMRELGWDRQHVPSGAAGMHTSRRPQGVSLSRRSLGEGQGDQHADTVRRDRRRLGRLRRLGGQAVVRSRDQGGAARGGQAAGRQADFTEHVPRYDLKYRDKASEFMRRTRPKQRDCYACREWNYKWFANDLEEPYTNPDDKPFSWQGRTRVVGGRTNVWGRQCYRLSEQDLKGKSFDGYGEDWPISYKELVPYYELVEDYVGISGQAENVPELPDSRFHPAMPMSCAETQLRTRVKSKLGWTVTIGRSANITKPINGRGAVPLLRAVRARLRHALLLQRRVHDRRRCAASPATPPSSPTRWSTRS